MSLYEGNDSISKHFGYLSYTPPLNLTISLQKYFLIKIKESQLAVVYLKWDEKIGTTLSQFPLIDILYQT